MNLGFRGFLKYFDWITKNQVWSQLVNPGHPFYAELLLVVAIP